MNKNYTGIYTKKGKQPDQPFIAFFTAGAILVPKISMDFISDACEGPPTSMWAEKRVRPNISCRYNILSMASLASPISRWPFFPVPASNCSRC